MPNDQEIRARFEEFDADKNGKIDETEFGRLAQSLGVKLSADEIATAFLAIDISGNGHIEFGEFRAWWQRFSHG